MKTQRQAKIMEIISTKDIETQDQLLQALQEAGFYSTQATISRDIKELRVVKELTSFGTYRYTTSSKEGTHTFSARLNTIFRECITGFDYAGKYDHDFWVNDIFGLMKRIKILMKWKCSPYVTRFYKYKESPYSGVIITVARWANQSSFYKKQSLMEFAEANGMNSSSANYLREFERQYPEIKPYFDMKIDGTGTRKFDIQQNLF